MAAAGLIATAAAAIHGEQPPSKLLLTALECAEQIRFWWFRGGFQRLKEYRDMIGAMATALGISFSDATDLVLGTPNLRRTTHHIASMLAPFMGEAAALHLANLFTDDPCSSWLELRGIRETSDGGRHHAAMRAKGEAPRRPRLAPRSLTRHP